MSVVHSRVSYCCLTWWSLTIVSHGYLSLEFRGKWVVGVALYRDHSEQLAVDSLVFSFVATSAVVPGVLLCPSLKRALLNVVLLIVHLRLLKAAPPAVGRLQGGSRPASRQLTPRSRMAEMYLMVGIGLVSVTHVCVLHMVLGNSSFWLVRALGKLLTLSYLSALAVFTGSVEDRLVKYHRHWLWTFGQCAPSALLLAYVPKLEALASVLLVHNVYCLASQAPVAYEYPPTPPGSDIAATGLEEYLMDTAYYFPWANWTVDLIGYLYDTFKPTYRWRKRLTASTSDTEWDVVPNRRKPAGTKAKSPLPPSQD
ncbi:putative transmembrane protein [Gregarina niphandrodes]|uniref:Transmembrane protein n=1 Tax=Gregarina niphandrodes TaxID=110365 RepID=A0A023BCP9_GRENI|nr:putative transmembrane protein [Gregarina niphandrodes]EZG83571.1 putative transmembrane protein [Gregarina niphandrodes]|eukprot:XP_011128932.1 putative transmembrane protein [Gregarina niphandrodes]